MILVGPPGSGKTHLAHLWAGEHDGTQVAGADLAAAGPTCRAWRPVRWWWMMRIGGGMKRPFSTCTT
jgi:MoxR-like ATPase